MSSKSNFLPPTSSLSTPILMPNSSGRPTPSNNRNNTPPLSSSPTNSLASHTTFGAKIEPATVEQLKDYTDKEFERVHKRLDGLQNDVTEIKADILGMKGDIKGLKKDVGELKDEVRFMKKDIAELKKDVKGLKTDVAELKTDVAELKKEVAGLKQDVKAIRTEMRTEFIAVRNEMKTEFAAVRSEMKTGFDELKALILALNPQAAALLPPTPTSFPTLPVTPSPSVPPAALPTSPSHSRPTHLQLRSPFTGEPSTAEEVAAEAASRLASPISPIFPTADVYKIDDTPEATTLTIYKTAGGRDPKRTTWGLKKLASMMNVRSRFWDKSNNEELK